ncbi:MAG: ribonuclease III [Oscillospiraceae bacterium]|nr:ribonuclease III [Oscillospiraceae bacterium]
MTELQKKLKYSFLDPSLLTTALTHSSYANERSCQSYERLEFVGDSVLGMVTAAHLYALFPNMTEGKMTRLRAELVCEQSLWHVAQRLELGRLLRLGRGEEISGGRERVSILADCVESIIAALYLEGGMDVAKRFIMENILNDVDENRTFSAFGSDYKTELQEFVQRDSANKLTYVQTGESGPDHMKVFVFEALVNGASVGRGEGHTKKEAEQNAARAALEEMKRR